MNYFAMHFLLTGLLARLASPLATEPSYVGPSVVREGVPFTLQCQLSIFATGQWTKDGELITWARLSEETTDYNERVMTLRVAEATPHHQGEYRCNRWSRKSHPLRISPVENTKIVETGDPISGVMNLKVGETIRLECEMDVDERLPINWYKNEHQLSPRSDLKIEGRQVTIFNARPSDAGLYMCSVASVSNALDGWIIHLQYPATVVPLPVEMESIQGDNLTLECRAFGHPEPRLSWLIGNVDVQTERNSRISLIPSLRNTQRFFLKEVEFADRDLYTCRAENALGTDETSTFLKIRESTIQTNAKDYTGILLMTLGQPLTLQCNTTEDPEWKVIWFKDDKRIESTDTRRRIHESNNSLMIEVAEEGDAGEYMCIVQGHKVKKIVSASIFVQKRRLSIWVKSEENPEFAVLTPGGNLTIRCQTEDPERGVIWYKDGDLLANSSGNLFFLENTTSLSIIKGDSAKDTGEYMCVARAKGFERLMNATVAVRTAPGVRPFHKSVSVVEGSSLDLRCLVVAGIPQPVVTWFKDDALLDEEEIELTRDEKGVHNAHLLIKKVELRHRAHYTCSASNGVAQANTTILLRVKDKFAAVWPLVGIVVELVILFVVIAIHEKRKVKTDINDDQPTFPPTTRNKETLLKTKVN